MKNYLLLFFIVLISCDKPTDHSLLIKDVSIISMQDGVEKAFIASILVRDSLIVKIGNMESMDLPRSTQIVDGHGSYIIPGLWDTHVHLFKTTRQSIPEFLRHGITSVRDMGGDTDTVKQIIRDIRLQKIQGPSIIFCGPTFENPTWMDYAQTHRKLHEVGEDISRTRINLKDKQDAKRIVDSVAALGVDFIKVRNFKDADTYWALAKAARERSLTLVGHAPYGIDPLVVSDSGQVSFEHGWYPSIAGLDEAAVAAIISAFKKNNCALVPTIITWKKNGFTAYSKLDSLVNGPAGIRDSRIDQLPHMLLKEWKAQLNERKNSNNLNAWNYSVMKSMLADTRRLYDGGVKLMAGSDVTSVNVYPGYSLHEELFLFVEEMGLTPLQALEIATIIPAQFFNLDAHLGTIEEGKLADLVILEKNPLENIHNISSIKMVFKHGKLIHE